MCYNVNFIRSKLLLMSEVSYITCGLSRSQSALVTQLRTGILPLSNEGLFSGGKQSCVIECCTNYDDLRELIFHEKAQ